MGVARVQFLALPGGSDDCFAWRLLGANNRELGRSGWPYADLDSCRLAVLDLLERLDQVEASMAAGPRNSAWTWRLILDGQAAASASRSYQRQRECAYNLERFLEALPVAIAPRAGDTIRRLDGLIA